MLVKSQPQSCLKIFYWVVVRKQFSAIYHTSQNCDSKPITLRTLQTNIIAFPCISTTDLDFFLFKCAENVQICLNSVNLNYIKMIDSQSLKKKCHSASCTSCHFQCVVFPMIVGISFPTQGQMSMLLLSEELQLHTLPKASTVVFSGFLYQRLS